MNEPKDKKFTRLAAATFSVALSVQATDPVILQNAAAEIIVRPDIGRILSFRTLEGSNVLWVAEDPNSFGPVPQYGGLRIMISPEVLWGQIRSPRRSDPATDGGPWTVSDQGGRHVRMETYSPDLGVKVRWTIRLHETEPSLSLAYEIERVKDNPFPVHVWSIAQVPLREKVWMSRVPHIDAPFHNFLRTPALNQAAALYQAEEALVFDGTQGSAPLKIGTFGTWIAHPHNGSTFVITAPAPQRLPYSDNSNLQAFAWPGRFPFYEIEVTSPMQHLKAGELLHAQETWRIIPLPEGSLSDHIRTIKEGK